MKIAYIVTLANHYGGAQVHVRDMAQWMVSKGHDVHVLSGAPGIVSNTIQQNGAQFHEVKSMARDLKPWQDINAFFQTRNILKSIKPDIVSCHSSKAGIIGRLAAKSLGIKVVFTAHGWSFTDGVSIKKKIIFKWAERLCRFAGNHIITVSRFDKFLALQNGVCGAHDISVVHNGMPHVPPPANNICNMTPQLLCVARFCAQKDHITLINALGQISDKDWHLNLVGSGDDTDCRAMVRSFNLDHKITFHGQRTDIADFMQTQDMVLLISNWEGFPRSIIEAMRASLPVITTRTGGSPEAVSHLQTGYVVPEQNPISLAAAITTLIDDPLYRHTLGEMGYKRYERYFTFETMATQTFRIYQTVVGIAQQAPAPAPAGARPSQAPQ